MMSLTFGLFTRVSRSGPLGPLVPLNPTALRKAKIVYNFGLSECNRVNVIYVTNYLQGDMSLAYMNCHYPGFGWLVLGLTAL